jgi:hypothetical protein
VYGQTDESSGQEKNQPIKIVALGDSLTYGVGDPTRMGYIGVVRNNIRKQTGRNVILNNLV